MPIPGLDVYPTPPPRGPLVVRGQVEIRSGENTARVVGITVESLSPDAVNALRGPPGQDGEDGRVGLDGPPGATGATGPSGAAGAQGPAGPAGLDGNDGRDGDVGPKGDTGPAGPPGNAGATGSAGTSGLDGEDGRDGLDGAPGATGPAGATGATGAQGPAGADGVAGLDGRDGDPGLDGVPGATGPAGAPGATGPTGPMGPPGFDGQDGQDGPQGPKGDTGPAGATGPTGPAGGGGGGAILAVATVDFGSTPATSGTFDITGLSGLTLNTNIEVSLAVNPVDPTEAEDSCVITGIAISTTVIRCYWNAFSNLLAGSKQVQYLVPTSVTFLGRTATQTQTGSATHNDYALNSDTGCLSVSADPTFTGFARAGGNQEGDWFTLRAGSASDVVTLQHLTGSVAANQIICPRQTSFILAERESVTLLYSNGAWHVVSRSRASKSVKNITPFNGAQGVVDISTLDCGGVLTVQSVTSDAIVDGFTAKPDGFFFFFQVRDASTSFVVRLVENSGNTSTSIRVPDIRDLILYKNDGVLLVYNNSRWRVMLASSKLWLLGVESQTITTQQNNFQRSSDGQNRIRISQTGSQLFTGLVPAANTTNGEIVVIENADSTEILTICHLHASSSAANQFMLPDGRDLILWPRTAAIFSYDDTTSNWRCIGHSAGDMGPAGPGTLLFEGQDLIGATAGSGQTTTTLVLPSSDASWQVLANAARGSYAPILASPNHQGVVRITTGGTLNDWITMFRNDTTASGGTGSTWLVYGDVARGDFWVRIPTAVTNRRVYVGFLSSANFSGTNIQGAYLNYDSAAGGNWRCISNDGATNQITTSGVAVTANNWYKLSVRNVNDEWLFYINEAFVAKHNVNVPSPAAACLYGYHIESVSVAGAKDLDCDRSNVYVQESGLFT